ncbi:glycoside hydrolase family 2 protein [Cohnella cholangitidis]|uniref:Glycoside hydrolase family 2 n=1 Tax=Cohnella cholangitidis TaxID=2598458 RepID=A0A7G5BWB8_9BACL|nr:sugar-binding domain-containing protein [Cohnella cholangitidis]QMV41252.1 glycoside hydrolase family 2 [Cohnella cholangitidis]
MREKQSLNGAWSFRIDRNDHGERQAWYASALAESREVEVPHIWQREDEHVHYCGTAWYEKSFDGVEIPAGRNLYLTFGAVDFQARVWLNGTYIGEHEGGFTPFEFEITKAFNPNGTNRLTVRVFDPQDNAEIPIGKQGSWYTRISGIWQEVSLELRSECYIQRAYVLPDIDKEIAEVRLTVSGPLQKSYVVEYFITDHLNPELPLAVEEEALTDGRMQRAIPLKDAILWSPDIPHLYDLIIKIKDSGSGVVLDEYSTYFGMRKIEFADGQLYLNRQPLFVRGALDQAFYPDTIFIAPSDEWIRNEIRLGKEMGFNLLRKHIKIEIPRYLYWADRMGMLIWAEPPNVVKWSAQSRTRFHDELVGMIERDFNHPSILIWSLYNEEWGLEWDLANDAEKQEHVIALYDEIKQLDPTRLICDNSGWIHVKTDINDYHRYFVVPEQIQEWKSDIDQYMAGHPEQNYVTGYAPKGEPIIVSEFGVWGLPSVKKLLEFYEGEPSWFANLGDDTHREDFKMPLTAYRNFEKYQLDRVFGDLENLSVHSQRRMFRAVKSLIEEMRKRPQINGYVVTEFTDIEWETNGWMDYTRSLKLGMERAADFNGSLVVMADGVNRNVWSGESQAWDIVISNHDLRPLQGVLNWEIEGTDLTGSIPLNEGKSAHVRKSQAIRFTVPQVGQSAFYTLKLSVELDGEFAARNEEELTFTPRSQSDSVKVCAYRMGADFASRLEANGRALTDELSTSDVVVTSVLDNSVLEYYRNGGHVVFLAEEGDGLSDKGQFTFRELVRGESWDRTSSFNYVDPSFFPDVPLRHEMGWEMDGLFPDFIIPFSNYNKLGGTIGRVVYMFGNESITESSEIVSGYFQGWIGQAGGSFLVQQSAQGSLTVTTWKLKNNYGTHPIATRIVDSLLSKAKAKR